MDAVNELIDVGYRDDDELAGDLAVVNCCLDKHFPAGQQRAEKQ